MPCVTTLSPVRLTNILLTDVFFVLPVSKIVAQCSHCFIALLIQQSGLHETFLESNAMKYPRIVLVVITASLFYIGCSTSTDTPSDTEKARRIYVANEESGTVSVLDGHSGNVIRTINLNAGPGHSHGGESEEGMFMLHNVQVAPDGHTVWVTAKPMDEASSEEVIIIDAHDFSVRQRVILEPELHVAHVVIDSRSKYAYVSANEADQVMQIAVGSGTLVRTFELPSGSNPHGMRFADDILYIANMGSKSLGILDVRTGAYDSVPLGGVAVQVALPADKTSAYVSLYDTKELVRYNISNKSISRIALPESAKGPVQLYPTPDSKYLLVADQGMLMDRPSSDLLFRVDLSTQQIDRELRVGAGAHGVVVSYDGKDAYVTNSEANTVSHVNLDSWTVAHTTNVDEAPNGVSYWQDMLGMP